MKRAICILALTAISCASQTTRLPIVRLGQMSLQYCADDTMQGKPMKRVMLIVVQPAGEDKPVVVTLTNGVKFRLIGTAVEIPSGLGMHRIVVNIGEREFVRSYRVFDCSKGIQPYME